ncbi:transcriptional regulator [Pantoea allii]|uniref:transcriptional regulator n=1 Tax=Pantoea allii TaxID=574096 RepID=UPI001561A159|nr:transcriptional regulator [Pantoea allii]NQS87467.1 transcriptional regulator [Pantoea allii]
MFIPKFFRWGQCSFDDYQIACNSFGYNCESAPGFIAFKMRHEQSFEFYAYKRKGKIVGSVCVENGWLANDGRHRQRSLPALLTPSTSVYVPFCNGVPQKVLLPFRCKSLHHLQSQRFLNTSYGLLSKSHAAFTKNPAADFSRKTVSTRERELRKFLNDGGSFLNVSQLDGEHIFDVFETLYQARRNQAIADREINKAFFREFQPCFKGYIMFLNNEPVALQLLLSVSSCAGMFVDFINIGYRMDSNAGAVGTMLMWKNLTSVYQDAADIQLPLYYSYGSMSGDYKNRWCHSVNNGRVII